MWSRHPAALKALSLLGGTAAAFVGHRVYRDGTFDVYNVGPARFGRAAFTVAAIGYDYKRSLYAPGVDPKDPGYPDVRSACHQRSADRLLKLCRDNGGCFIKVGQHIGALDYLLPDEYVNTMKVLHHNAPEMGLRDVFAVIREDLGRDPEVLFSEFDPKPLGTASLAQVHKARLRTSAPKPGEEKPEDKAENKKKVKKSKVFRDPVADPEPTPPPPDADVVDKALGIQDDLEEEEEDDEDEDEEGELGPWVAVKVQHRYVKNHSFVDIHTMDFLVRTVKYFFPQFEFMWLAEEMRKNLPLELSFTQEARNAEKIASMLDYFDWLKIPEVVWELTTDRVLTMEFCRGGHINDLEYLRRHRIDPIPVSSKISQMYADMIFKFGYVHCDPHPGNVLVQKDPQGHVKIVLLDHGLYTQLTHDFRLDYAHFWLSILNRDAQGIRKYADKLGVGQLYGLFACMVAGRSWASIQKGLGKTKKTKEESQEIKDKVQQYFRQIADILAFVNRQMILIFKTNDLLRAIEHSLGTGNSMNSFVQMSRACFRCLNNDRYRNCRSSWCRLCVATSSFWDQFKITCYQVFLWAYWSRMGFLIRWAV